MQLILTLLSPSPCKVFNSFPFFPLKNTYPVRCPLPPPPLPKRNHELGAQFYNFLLLIVQYSEMYEEIIDALAGVEVDRSTSTLRMNNLNGAND